jgi:preprotein translocase subunit SecG
MVQNPKGGGLSYYCGSQMLGGYKNNRLFLDKSTWTLAILIALIYFLALALQEHLVILILKSLKTQEVQHQLQTPATPATNTPAAANPK